MLCYVVFKRVSLLAKESGERTWARFTVVRFLWEKLEKDLRIHRKTVVPALRQPDKWPKIVAALDKAIEAVMLEAVAYYGAKGRNAKGEREDAQKFFKRAESYEAFNTWWRGSKNKHRAALKTASASLLRELKAAQS